MSLLGKAKVAIHADLGPLKRGLARARSVVIGSMRSITTSITASMKKIASTIARIMKRVAQLMVIGFGLSMKAMSSFKQQVAVVSTMLDKQTMTFLPQYSKALKQMAVEFGEGTDTLSKGLYDILSASIPADKALMVLAISAKAAAAGVTDTGVAADAITTILNSYQMQTEGAGKVSDWLFAIVKKGKTTFAELAPNIGKVVSIAAVAGLRFEQLGAAISTMTRAGMRSDLAITSLRAIIMAFLKPQSDSIILAEKFGFEMKASTLSTLGLAGVIKKLKNANAEELAILIPMSRAIAGFASLLKQSTGFANDYKFILEKTGLTEEAFLKVTDTLSFKMKQLWQVIKFTGINIGEAFNDDAKKVVEKITKAILDAQPAIEMWAKKVAVTMVYIKDIMKAFYIWIKGDWKANLKTSLEATVPLWRALGDSIVLIMKATGIRAYEALTKVFGDKLGRWMMELGRPEGPLGKLSMLIPGIAAARIGVMKAGAGLVKKSKEPSTVSLKDTMKDISKI